MELTDEEFRALETALDACTVHSHRRVRPLWRRERTMLRTVCPDDGRAWIPDLGVRPFLLWGERIGIIGICGWGGLAISAAVMDTRIKATVSSTMGAFDTYTSEERYEARRQLNEQRTVDARNGYRELAGGVPAELPADAPQFMKDYHDYYKTPRGYHPLLFQQAMLQPLLMTFCGSSLAYKQNQVSNCLYLVYVEQ